MAVTFDAVGTGEDSGGAVASPQVLAAVGITIGSGANRALVVQLCFGIAVTAPTCRWDDGGTNQTMTLIGSAQSGGGQTVCLFGLVAPTSGSSSFRVTWTGAVSEVMLQAVSWTGVDQTGGATSFPHFTSATGSSTAASVTVTSATGNATMDAIAAGLVGTISAISATQTFIEHGATTLECGGSRAAGAASNTMTATFTPSDQWVAIGCDIAAPGGGGDTLFSQSVM